MAKKPQPKAENKLLPEMLSMAVPLWIEELRPLTDAERFARIKGAAQLIAEKGDVMLFGGGKPGEPGEIFNRLAESIAVMAYIPGGITTFGIHFDASHKLGEKR